MNLLDDRDRTIQALTEIEGQRWLERQKRGDFKGYSVFDAIRELEEISIRDPQMSIRTIIYGNDGWNRYRVTTTGEVQFIEAQKWGQAPLAKAKELGFEIV